MSKAKQEYAVYKGEKFLCSGTAAECAEILQVAVKTIRWLSTPAAEKRIKGNNSLIAVKLKEEECC